jgi:hypothetical protein
MAGVRFLAGAEFFSFHDVQTVTEHPTNSSSGYRGLSSGDKVDGNVKLTTQHHLVPYEGKGRERKGREGKGREGKGRGFVMKNMSGVRS